MGLGVLVSLCVSSVVVDGAGDFGSEFVEPGEGVGHSDCGGPQFGAGWAGAGGADQFLKVF
jgi:hypothetical protein